MGELSTQQRIAEAVRRKCVGPCGLSSDMARVLACIVTRVADGTPMPHQDLLAAELGIPPRTLSRCISRLGRAHGLVFVQRVGREPARYHVGWVELEAWAAGELRSATECFDSPPWRIEASNGSVPRVRAATSSSTFSPPPPAPPPPHPAHDDGDRVLRAFGVDTLGNEDEVDRVLWLGATVDDLRRLTKRARALKGREINLAYVVSAVENDLERRGRRPPGNIVPFREPRAGGGEG